MKKSAVMGVAALVAAMSLGIAAPASAQACSGNIPAMPASNTISNEGGQLRINPDGPSEDVENLGDYVNDRVDELADCAVDSVPSQVWCAYDVGLNAGWYMYYVYTDPYTGEVVIDYGRAQDDVNDCL